MPITAWFDAQLDTLFLNSFGTREFLSVADWPRLIAAPDHDDCGSALTRGDFACGKSDESASLRLLLRDPLALLPCFRQADGDRLLTAFDLAAFPARPAFGFSPLVTVHLGFDVAPGALGIFAFGGLWHGSPQSDVKTLQEAEQLRPHPAPLPGLFGFTQLFALTYPFPVIAYRVVLIVQVKAKRFARIL